MIVKDAGIDREEQYSFPVRQASHHRAFDVLVGEQWFQQPVGVDEKPFVDEPRVEGIMHLKQIQRQFSSVFSPDPVPVVKEKGTERLEDDFIAHWQDAPDFIVVKFELA